MLGTHMGWARTSELQRCSESLGLCTPAVPGERCPCGSLSSSSLAFTAGKGLGGSLGPGLPAPCFMCL